MSLITSNPSLELAIVTTIVALLLVGRKFKEQRELLVPAGAFRLRWDLIAGVIMWCVSSWFALIHTYYFHVSGAVIGAVGCCYMLYGAFMMNRRTMTAPAPTNKEIRMSELKKARKKP